MTPGQLRRVAVGSRIGWLPTGEVGRIQEKLEDGLIVLWVNGTTGKVTWSEAVHVAHVGRIKPLLMPRRVPVPPERRGERGRFLPNGAAKGADDA